MSQPITREMFDAWETLREAAASIGSTDEFEATSFERNVANAINVLDASCFLEPIVNKFVCGDASAGLPEPPCDLEKPCPVHDVRMPVAIEQVGPLFQARGADGKVWSTATTYDLVGEHLSEQATMFIIVTSEELGGDDAHPSA